MLEKIRILLKLWEVAKRANFYPQLRLSPFFMTNYRLMLMMTGSDSHIQRSPKIEKASVVRQFVGIFRGNIEMAYIVSAQKIERGDAICIKLKRRVF